MSIIGELCLRPVFLRSRRGRGSGEETHLNYFRQQLESSQRLFRNYPGLDFQGKRVLEIGCGVGGRTAFAAAQGASEAVGIDINAEEIGIARQLAAAEFSGFSDRLRYLVSREDELLDIGQFDIVLLVDTLEHVVSPPSIVRLAYLYTEPGAKCYMSSIGWYHVWGSHTGVPFANVLFSDETICNVIRWYVSRPDYQPNRFDSSPPVERWRGIYDLRDRPGEHLNKITIREMKKLARHSSFESGTVRVLGYSNPKLTLLRPLASIPLLQEIFHSVAVIEFTKSR